VKKRWRNAGLYVLLAVVVIAVGTAFLDRPDPANAPRTLRYSDFVEAVEGNEVSRVLIAPDRGTAQVVENNGQRAVVNLAPDKDLLKLLEEPPSKTVFILTASDQGSLLETLRSRCQLTTLQGFSQGEMVNYLTQQGVPNSTAINLAQQSQGNMNKALDLLAQDSEEQVFGQWMVQWIRSAFKAKTQKSAVQELMMWSQEVAKVGRETQKNFHLN